jgi:transcriptional regulator with XRE-family HTH domain
MPRIAPGRFRRLPFLEFRGWAGSHLPRQNRADVPRRKASARNRSSEPLEQAVKGLLASKGWSLRRLAAEVGVDVAHLSRTLYSGTKRPSTELLARVSAALGVPPDYFAEVREAVVVGAVRDDPRLRDDVYDRLSTEERRRRLDEFREPQG